METYEALNFDEVAQQNTGIYDPLANGIELRPVNALVDSRENIYHNWFTIIYSSLSKGQNICQIFMHFKVVCTSLNSCVLGTI